MSCHNCYGSQTGIGSINTGQYPSNTGNAPRIDTFGQRSEQRPNEYWNGKLMRERIPPIAGRPSGIWPKPDRNCLCNIAERTYQRVDRPTLASQARSIVLPEVPCGGRCDPRDVTQRRIREMRGFSTDNPRRTIPLAQLPEIDACNATLLAGAPIVAQRCPLQGDILYYNGRSWCLTQLRALIEQCYGCKCGCSGNGSGEKKQDDCSETANTFSDSNSEAKKPCSSFTSTSSSSYQPAQQVQPNESPFSSQNVSSSSTTSTFSTPERYRRKSSKKSSDSSCSE